MLRFFPKLKLHAALGGPHGITIESAVSRATVEMDVHRDAAFDVVDERIAALRAKCASHAGALDAAEIYRLAEDIVDLGGLFSPPLCHAAQSLCALAQKAMPDSALDKAAVVVHVESLHVLRTLGSDDSPMTRAVLDGLVAVVAKAR